MNDDVKQKFNDAFMGLSDNNNPLDEAIKEFVVWSKNFNKKMTNEFIGNMEVEVKKEK